MVHGSYQSGTGVLDFSNTSRAREIAFADPAPLRIRRPQTIGGDWATYFYNGYLYDSDITRGLYIWRLDERDASSAMRMRHLNPQTQEFTIGAKKDHDRWNHDDRWHDDDDDRRRRRRPSRAEREGRPPGRPSAFARALSRSCVCPRARSAVRWRVRGGADHEGSALPLGRGGRCARVAGGGFCASIGRRQQHQLRPRWRQRFAHASGAVSSRRRRRELHERRATCSSTASSERPLATPNPFSHFSSDLAFWGDKVYQGSSSGFRIIDIDDPRQPAADQTTRLRARLRPGRRGDLGHDPDPVVGREQHARTRTCDGEPVPGPPRRASHPRHGFEGLHVFDVTDPATRTSWRRVDLACGSHTASGVPDVRNRRLMVYSTPSSGACDGIDIVEVPLSRPQEAEVLRFELAGPQRGRGQWLRVP